MPRPRKCRRIDSEFGISFFGPKGIPMRDLEQVVVTHDEVEALRLADLEQMYQEQAAGVMQVSRATFGRILSMARRKLSDALINGKSIVVEGGSYAVGSRVFNCRFWQSNRRDWKEYSQTGDVKSR